MGRALSSPRSKPAVPANFPAVPPAGASPGVRVGLVWPYVIIYDYVEANDIVMILRVLHGRQRCRAAF
jgi:plasmid stabilization system protein ParE